MTPGTLPRRLLVGACALALVGGVVGAVPLLGSASAAGCPAWTDPADDATTAQLPLPPLADKNMDLLAATFSTTATAVTATFKVAALTDTASDYGDEFHMNFTAAGKDLQVYSDRDGVGPFGDEAGFYNFTDNKGAGGKAKATYDVPSNTVTISGSLADLATLAGVPLAGKPISALEAGTQNFLQPAATGLPYDDAATTQTLVLGVDCAGGTTTPGETGTPAPTGSGTPSASPSPTPTSSVGPDGLFLQPRKGCVQFKDATGDADPFGDPVGLDQEDSLDVTQVNLKSPAGLLQIFVGLVDPSADVQNPPFSGRTYAVSFTVGTKTVTLTAPGDGAATATVGSAANSDIKATAKVDSKNKNIVFTVPLAGLAKATGTTITKGTKITGTSVTTKAGSPLGAQTADTASGSTTAEKTYTYGDNGCFMPPPGVIAIDADPRGQYGDRTVVYATLHDADDTAVSGVKVTGILTGGRAVSDITDADGIATLALPLTMAAGTKTLTVTYAGDPEVGAARSAKSFVVVPEKSVLRVTALRGGAQATVVDDDRPAHAIVGRYVRFTVGGRTWLRKTNSRGVAAVTGFAKGTAIKITFLPVKNLYLGTSTVTVRAR